jgi:hypothetical protein
MPQEPGGPEVGEAKSSKYSYQSQNDAPTAPEDKHQDFRSDIIGLPKEIRNILAGGIAGMVAKSVVAPLDRIKILYQVSSAKFFLRDIPRVVKNIVENEGLSALWKGNTATMVRVFPYSGIQFMVFERMKGHFLKKHERGLYFGDVPSADSGRKFGLSPLESFVGGMVAGTISVVCTYPLDLARAQLAVLKKHRHGENPGFRQVLLDTHKHRGTTGLFRGLTPTLLGILPYSGIAFALNEQGKREVCSTLIRSASGGCEFHPTCCSCLPIRNRYIM